MGNIPRENIKKYGNGLLIKAKDLTQTKMLLHLQCSDKFYILFCTAPPNLQVLPEIVFNYDLGEFSEDDIYAMCPPTVQKMWKVRGKDNVIVVTFYGSSHPITSTQPLRLRVKTFIDNPLQCFGCYELGHSRKHSTTTPDAAASRTRIAMLHRKVPLPHTAFTAKTATS